ncbi:hypothetical protein Slin15195_G062570 [Septoria linicola]|uniref:GPI anchored protein n=1 Tax=Septoria linicola TaxID=215465 RepID=A0A9Q9EL11_9PEZI|nr:hypothetical protein Slin15195_G062570 [Septoria linicola]
MASKIVLASLLSAAMAQTTTLQIPLYGYDSFTIDASIIAVQNSVTTISLACPSSADECGLFPQQTLTYGPSTYRMEMGTGDAEFTGSQICQATVCTESAGGSGANDPGSSTTTYDDVETMPVTVTAGAALLRGGDAGATNGGGSASASATMTFGGRGTMSATGTASSSEMSSASRTSSGAAETSSSAASAHVVARGGIVGGLAAVIALML